MSRLKEQIENDPLLYVKLYFKNSSSKDMSEAIRNLKETNRPFLEKHTEYVEDHEITAGEVDTVLEYILYKYEFRESQTLLQLPEENL